MIEIDIVTVRSYNMTTLSLYFLSTHGGDRVPHSTFFNLPEEKRERILENAIDEFAEMGYTKASISRIVQKSKIAKGSFYQYFEDKKDLYKYLIDRTGEQKLVFINDQFPDMATLPFFELMHALYVVGMRFAATQPKMTKIVSELMKRNDDDLKAYVLGDNQVKGHEFLLSLLQMADGRGELREGLDLDFTAYILHTMNTALADYYYMEHDQLENDGEVEQLADRMLDILKNGIYKQRE